MKPFMVGSGCVDDGMRVRVDERGGGEERERMGAGKVFGAASTARIDEQRTCGDGHCDLT